MVSFGLGFYFGKLSGPLGPMDCPAGPSLAMKKPSVVPPDFTLGGEGEALGPCRRLGHQFGHKVQRRAPGRRAAHAGGPPARRRAASAWFSYGDGVADAAHEGLECRLIMSVDTRVPSLR